MVIGGGGAKRNVEKRILFDFNFVKMKKITEEIDDLY